jgi:hypothetical protein
MSSLNLSKSFNHGRLQDALLPGETTRKSCGLDLSDFDLRLSLLASRCLKIDEQTAINTEYVRVVPQLLLLALAHLSRKVAHTVHS